MRLVIRLTRRGGVLPDGTSGWLCKTRTPEGNVVEVLVKAVVSDPLDEKATRELSRTLPRVTHFDPLTGPLVEMTKK